MRATTFLPVIPILIVACSSDAEGTGPTCKVAGTYSVSAAKESGTCDQVYADVMASAGDTTVTYSITATADPKVFALNFTGLTGSCPLQQTEACKLEGPCELTFGSAKGTFQAAWTFTDVGFAGIETTSLPAITDASGKQRAACIQTDKSTGTRR